MKALLLVLALCGVAHAGGAPVELDLHEAPFHDLMRLLGDVGRVNIVVVDVPPLKVEAKYKRVAWDKVLADLVKKAKLASFRDGNVILIGDPALIEARKKLRKRAFKGPNVDADLVDADSAGTAALLAVVSKKPVEITGGTKHINQRFRRVPLDQLVELVAILGGGTVATKPSASPPKPAGCHAPAADVTSLKLAGIAGVGTTRRALLLDGSGTTFVAANKDCVGKTGNVVSDIGAAYVTLTSTTKTEELSISLYPRSREDRDPR
jgi:hypothetical protein